MNGPSGWPLEHWEPGPTLLGPTSRPLDAGHNGR